MSSPVLAPVNGTGDTGDPASTGRSAAGRGRRGRLALAAAATAAAVLAGTWAVPHDGGGSAWATELVAVAEANARVLVDRSGWTVTRVDEFSAADGEMTFSGDGRSLDVHWRPAASYGSFVDDRKHGSPATAVRVLGRDGLMFDYGGGDYTTILPVEGPNFLEIRGNLGDEAAYRAILGDLRTVDVDTWLSALPPSAVATEGRDAVVAAMLRGVRVPAGFDPAGIRTGGLVRDRYQLGAAVTGAVACAWLDVWSAATERGDRPAAADAAAAVQGSRDWPVLREMDAAGDYPEAVAEAGDLMAGAGTPPKGGSGPEAVVANVTGMLGCEMR